MAKKKTGKARIQLRVKQVATASLIPYARNARLHTDRQVAAVAASIREFGWTNPVLVDPELTIIAGHCRVLAAQLLGMDQVPCFVLRGLSDAKVKALRITDNKLALNSAWDADLLTLELKDLKKAGVDLELVGFDPDELQGLLDDKSEPGDTAAEGTRGDIMEAECPACGEKFTIKGRVTKRT